MRWAGPVRGGDGARVKNDSAADWSLRVTEDQPHDLAELERQLAGHATEVINRSRQPTSKKVLHGLYLFSSALAVVGPIAAVTVFFDLSDAPTRAYDFDAGFELVVAFVGFAFGILFQGRMLYRWWNEGKKRDSVMLFFSFGVLLCALGTIAQAYDINDANPMLVTVCLLPAFVTGLGAVATIVVNLAAREKTPYYKAPDPPPPLDLTQLTGDARAAVLKDRHKALESLRARGLLEGYDVDDLASRPLGYLAADEKDAD